MSKTTDRRHPKFIDPKGFQAMLNRQPPKGAVLVEVNELLSWLVEGKSQRDFFDMLKPELEATHRVPGTHGTMIDVADLRSYLKLGRTECEFFDLFRPDFLFNLESYWKIVGGPGGYITVLNDPSHFSAAGSNDAGENGCMITSTPNTALLESAFVRWVHEGFDPESVAECRQDIDEHLKKEFGVL